MSDEKVDAWMPLWIGAYLADTMHLSRDSHGGYLLLLFAYWRNRGPLPDDDEDMAGITKATPAEWKKLRAKLERFFTVEDGVWVHGRADDELRKAGQFKAAAVKRASAGGKALAEKRRKQADELAASSASSSASSTPPSTLGACSTPSPIPLPSGDSEAKASAADADPTGDGGQKSPADMTKAELWRAGKSLLLEAGVPEAQCGSFVGKLVKDYTDEIVVEAVRAAVVAEPADPKEYLKATCMRLKGERAADHGKPLTVPSQEAEKTAAEIAAGRARDATLNSPENQAARVAAMARLGRPVQPA